MSKLKTVGWWILWALLLVLTFISDPLYLRRRNARQSKKEMNDTRAKFDGESANTEQQWLSDAKQIDKERNSN